MKMPRFSCRMSLDQMDRGVEVAVKGAAGKDAIGIAGSVELELVHAVAVHHLQAGLLECAVVLRAGESVAVAHDLVAVRAAEGDALLLRLAIAAPRRQPHADAGVNLLRRLRDFGEIRAGSRC